MKASINIHYLQYFLFIFLYQSIALGRSFYKIDCCFAYFLILGTFSVKKDILGTQYPQKVPNRDLSH